MHYKPISHVFPAYAGVNLVRYANDENQQGIPRVCGGEPADIDKLFTPGAYSPRMRG